METSAKYDVLSRIVEVFALLMIQLMHQFLFTKYHITWVKSN